MNITLGSVVFCVLVIIGAYMIVKSKKSKAKFIKCEKEENFLFLIKIAEQLGLEDPFTGKYK